GETRMAGTVADAKVAALVTSDYVAPAVSWLCSEQCNVSGEVIGASGGYFTAVRFYRSEGVLLRDNNTVPSVDEFAAAAGQIFDFSKPLPVAGTAKEFLRRMREAGLYQPWASVAMAANPGMNGGPLVGIKVLDLSNVGPGARCARMLADFGASVTRIVPPARKGGHRIEAPYHAYGGGRGWLKV